MIHTDGKIGGKLLYGLAVDGRLATKRQLMVPPRARPFTPRHGGGPILLDLVLFASACFLFSGAGRAIDSQVDMAQVALG